MRAWPAVVEAARDVLDAALVRPVREGRPRPRRWPPGLVAVGTVTLVLYVLLAAAAGLATTLRAQDRLLVSYATGLTLPAVTVPLLLGGLTWSMVLLHTAALHTRWWPRLALAVTSVVAIGLFGMRSWAGGWQLGVSVVLYLGLWGFILVRSRYGYAWWEVVVVGLWVTAVLYVPWTGAGIGDLLGVDHRVPAIQGTLEALQVLSVPALMAAGCAPALITSTAAETLASRPFPRRLAVALLAALAVWRAAEVAWSVREGDADLAWPNLFAAATTVLVVLVLAEVLRARSGRPQLPGPGALPEIWSAYVWPLAMSLGWVVLLIMPLAVASTLLGDTDIGRSTLVPFFRWFTMSGAQAFRLTIGVVALLLAWRLAKAERVAAALLLTAFSAYAVVQKIGPMTGVSVLGLQTAAALAAVSSGVTLVLLIGYGVAGRLTRRRTVGLATVLLVGALYPHRSLLDDPISTLLGYAGLAALLFGLVWQLVTNGDYTDGDSRTFPRSTRVLLYLANALFAVTGAAYVALSRESGGADATDWTELGDDLLGTPLFVAVVVAGLWTALGRQPEHGERGDQVRDLTD